MFELLFLLLPIAAVYGYYMGYNSSRQKQQNLKNKQNSNYLKGFDYLLNNKQDKAVDKFIAFLNSKDPSFESSLALGNLFRQRGEVDKAIALHEKMSSDENIDDSEKEISLLELSRDFISAGLLDRAEDILVKTVDIPRLQNQSAILLLSVYEKEQDYVKAIEIANRYSDTLEGRQSMQVSQYYCEIAKQLYLNGDKEQAAANYRKAIDCCKKSIRARLELAEILVSQNNLLKASQLIKEVSIIEPNSGVICLEKLKKCFPNSADPNYRFALEDLVHRTNSAEAMVELVKTVEQQSGKDDAEALLLSFIKNKSNLKLFSALLELRSHGNDATSNESIMQIKSILDAQIALSNKYSCPNCGFESKIMFWQCPSCRKWESLKPKIGLDGD